MLDDPAKAPFGIASPEPMNLLEFVKNDADGMAPFLSHRLDCIKGLAEAFMLFRNIDVSQSRFKTGRGQARIRIDRDFDLGPDHLQKFLRQIPPSPSQATNRRLNDSIRDVDRRRSSRQVSHECAAFASVHSLNRIGQCRCLTHPPVTVDEEFCSRFTECPRQAAQFAPPISEIISFYYAVDAEGLLNLSQ